MASCVLRAQDKAEQEVEGGARSVAASSAKDKGTKVSGKAPSGMAKVFSQGACCLCGLPGNVANWVVAFANAYYLSIQRCRRYNFFVADVCWHGELITLRQAK
eukprot:368770-Amphidinium_carterae.1